MSPQGLSDSEDKGDRGDHMRGRIRTYSMEEEQTPAAANSCSNSRSLRKRILSAIPAPLRFALTRVTLLGLVIMASVFLLFIIQIAVKVGKMQVTVLVQSSPCKDCKPGAFSDKPFPRLLHQTWKNSSVPEKWLNSSQSCRSLNPDYEYRLWTDEDIETLIKTEYSWFYETYKSYPYNIQRADAGRYFILYHYGGVYTDLDIMCRKTFDYILHNVTKYDIVFPQGPPIGVTAEVMFAKPRHPYLNLVLHSLIQSNVHRVFPYATIMFSTGPLFLSIVLTKYEYPEQVYIIPYQQYTQELFTNLHGGSWHEWDGDFIFWAYCHKLPIFIVLVVLVLAVVLCCKVYPKNNSPTLLGYKKVQSL